MKIYNQTTEITSNFNEELFIKSLRSQLSDKIFKDLIQNENEAITIHITMELKKKDK